MRWSEKYFQSKLEEDPECSFISEDFLYTFLMFLPEMCNFDFISNDSDQSFAQYYIVNLPKKLLKLLNTNIG